jgi:hypothetical protein
MKQNVYAVHFEGAQYGGGGLAVVVAESKDQAIELAGAYNRAEEDSGAHRYPNTSDAFPTGEVDVLPLDPGNLPAGVLAIDTNSE